MQHLKNQERVVARLSLPCVFFFASLRLFREVPPVTSISMVFVLKNQAGGPKHFQSHSRRRSIVAPSVTIFVTEPGTTSLPSLSA